VSGARKTNALRILESLGVPHRVAEHPVPDAAAGGRSEGHLDAVQVARILGVSPGVLFKTLVAHGGREQVFVFCIPAAEELDLKKAARVAGVRSVDLVPLKDLTPLTGYVRGGCSPIGMKKKFPVWIDESATRLSSIYVNAGSRGLQVVIAPDDLRRVTGAIAADLCVSGA